MTMLKIMLAGTSVSCIVSSAYHLKCALAEYLFLYQGRILQGGNVDAVREETGKSLDELFREVFKCLPNC